jgi:hypothetical protein
MRYTLSLKTNPATRIANFGEASIAVRSEIETAGAQAGEWYGWRPDIGTVYEDGRPVAKISYTGRVWTVNDVGGWNLLAEPAR